MDTHNLIVMANRIGEFFVAQPDRDEALAGIAEHIRKFWVPRMRSEILAVLGTDAAAELDDVVVAALTTHRARLEPAPTRA
ncbi:MAG: formate dehydrogenase subunit delta [Burkholderiales bacterium]|jgi:formate dehydrogenase subunit delta|nr:formate dehydrogenase subunit delta [Burkholderiales bacterium]